jgi:hypothetical protein
MYRFGNIWCVALCSDKLTTRTSHMQGDIPGRECLPRPRELQSRSIPRPFCSPCTCIRLGTEVILIQPNILLFTYNRCAGYAPGHTTRRTSSSSALRPSSRRFVYPKPRTRTDRRLCRAPRGPQGRRYSKPSNLFHLSRLGNC